MDSTDPGSATARAFANYLKDFGAPRHGTEGSLAGILRELFPTYHVTCTDVTAIIKFAEAGKASCKILLEGGQYDVIRSHRWWSHSRKEAGELFDHAHWGPYTYCWEDCNFLIFQLRFKEAMFGSESERLFVLAPRDQGEIIDGRHSLTEKLILAAGYWDKLEQDTVWVFDRGHWSKDRNLWKAAQETPWGSVIMDHKTKQNLIDDVMGFFNNKDLYHEFAVPWKRGIILHGAPGNGKTLTIRALISALADQSDHIPTLYVKSLKAESGPQISLGQIFVRARSLGPCLLVFEDLDSLIEKKVRSYFLNEIDGINSQDSGVLIIGTTNHLSKLDPAIAQRPSRFDRKYHFPSPDFSTRLAYCQYWRHKLAKNRRGEFPEQMNGVVAELAEGFTFAMINELFISTMLRYVADGGVEVGVGITEPSIDVQIPSILHQNRLLQVFVQQASILRREIVKSEHEKSHEEATDAKSEDISDKDSDDELGPRVMVFQDA